MKEKIYSAIVYLFLLIAFLVMTIGSGYVITLPGNDASFPYGKKIMFFVVIFFGLVTIMIICELLERIFHKYQKISEMMNKLKKFLICIFIILIGFILGRLAYGTKSIGFIILGIMFMYIGLIIILFISEILTEEQTGEILTRSIILIFGIIMLYFAITDISLTLFLLPLGLLFTFVGVFGIIEYIFKKNK